MTQFLIALCLLAMLGIPSFHWENKQGRRVTTPRFEDIIRDILIVAVLIKVY